MSGSRVPVEERPHESADALRVTDTMSIPRRELLFRATRSGGPGGQHVNTSSTRAEVSWNVKASAAITDDVRERLLLRLASRLGNEGVLRVASSQSRSQLQNRGRAERRLAELVAAALAVPKARRKTRVPRAATEERLRSKKLRAEKKQRRREED